MGIADANTVQTAQVCMFVCVCVCLCAYACVTVEVIQARGHKSGHFRRLYSDGL